MNSNSKCTILDSICIYEMQISQIHIWGGTRVQDFYYLLHTTDH